jgi:hypothetical protein
MKNEPFIFLNASINQLSVHLPIVLLYPEAKNTFFDSLSRYSCKKSLIVYLISHNSLKKNGFVYKQRLCFIPSSDNSLKSNHISCKSCTNSDKSCDISCKSWTNSYKSCDISLKSYGISLKSWFNSLKSRGNSCKQNRRLIQKKQFFQSIFPEAHPYQPFFILNNKLLLC